MTQTQKDWYCIVYKSAKCLTYTLILSRICTRTQQQKWWQMQERQWTTPTLRPKSITFHAYYRCYRGRHTKEYAVCGRFGFMWWESRQYRREIKGLEKIIIYNPKSQQVQSRVPTPEIYSSNNIRLKEYVTAAHAILPQKTHWNT